ncbi:dihydroxyacetone kinase subunit DhaL [Escherichia coli]|uniref:Dihydroxyacetone kinase subunit DhaL n=1 Tax=Escherichia coli TaxID=562 RepID=A0A377D2H9_ECOLX|nr:dihydroxyacetone kinase subunit DhaL [Escherichia coli]
MFRDGADGVISRGKAEPGDKTMCDVWVPVVESLRQSSEQNLSVPAALDAAVASPNPLHKVRLRCKPAKAAPVISVNAVLVTRTPVRPR